MLTLATFLILLLAGAAAVVVATLLRPRHTLPAALAALGITSFLWLLAPGQLPLSYTLNAALVSTTDFTWTWQVQRPLWLLSLALFLLQLGALLYLLTTEAPEARARQARIVVLLGATAHFAFWASSLAALVAAWSLLAVLWGLGRREPVAGRRNVQSEPGRAVLRVIAIFLLWLAAASIPGAAPTTGAAGWPLLATSLVLLAIVVQLSLAPVALQQLSRWQGQTRLNVLHDLLPAVAGAALLLRLEAAGDVGLGFALPLTLAGLFGLLWAGRRAWSAIDERVHMAPALIVAQTSLILLAGVWATPQAVLAETRVLLLGGGLLALATPRLEGRRDRGGQFVAIAAHLLALAALLGLPLTAGFQGRAALYGVWAAGGRWLLIVVTALLHLPLAAAALLEMQKILPAKPSKADLDRGKLLHGAGLLLPALGLLGVAALATASIPAWLAVLAPLLLAWPLASFLADTGEVERTVHQAFQFRFPAGAAAFARRAARGAGHALREAALILEGESGLLWLLLFLVILWLAR